MTTESFRPVPWKVTQERTVVDKPWLKVTEQSVVTSSGVTIEEFHLVRSPDWVAALTLTNDGYIVVVDQYRHGAGQVSCELPAGVVDAGEEPLAAAMRELREETGYVAEAWRPLMTASVEPSRNDNCAHFFFATAARPAFEPNTEPCEHIRHRLVLPCDLLAAIDRGEVIHGVHVGAILLAHRRGYF